MASRAALGLAALALVVVLGGMASAVPTPDPGLNYAAAGPGPLRLRAGPGPGAAVVATLPAGTRDIVLTGRRAEGEGGEAWEVLAPGAADRPAWAAAAQLSPGTSGPADFPLQCSGTEPFWGLRLSGSTARMSRPGRGDQAFAAGSRQVAAGDPRVHVRRLSGPGREAGQVVVIRRAAGCTDGMSDLSYPYEAVVTLPSGEVLAGCCRRAGG